MSIRPVKGMCIVKEDVKDDLEGYSKLAEMGFSQSEIHQVNVGVSGIVLAAGSNEHGIKEGDHIVYSQFTAEQILLKDEEGKPMKNIKSVPTDSVLGFLD